MKKSLIKLGIVMVLIVAVMFLALNGLQIGKYILKPVSSAISLGLDLRGGVSTEYIATDTSVDNFDVLLEGTVSALRTRLTNAGFTEANVAVQGNDRILVEIPDVDDPEEVIEIIGTPAHLEFRDPLGNVVVEGKNIKKAEPMQDEKGICFVSFEMDEEGTAAFRDATSEFIGETISIYLDDELISAPVVDEVIPDGKGMISAGDEINVEDSYEFATNLSMLIQSGALPLDIEEIETRAISATLGLEAIDGAVIAGAVGLILVMLFMLAVYRLPGLAADMALLVYILIVFYALAIFGAQLTFPTYIGAMVVAAIIRNFCDVKHIALPSKTIDIWGNVSLSIFLAIALMTLKLWQLIDLAIPMIVMLIAQTVLMFLFARFVVFNIMGRDYEAAVMTSAFCGFGMGATPNAMANMQVLTKRYGPAPQAFFIVPLVGSLFADFFNGIIITAFLNFLPLFG